MNLLEVEERVELGRKGGKASPKFPISMSGKWLMS
jgi:hypothetical protein